MMARQSTAMAHNLNNNIILFTTGSYSNTTAKHINHVHRAIDSQKKIFYVDNVQAVEGYEHLQNFNDYVERFKDKLKESVKSRKYKATLFDDALRIAHDANFYAKIFNLAIEPIDIEKYDLNEIVGQLKIERAKKLKQKKERAKQLLIDQAETIANWRNGERADSLWQLPCMLRINKENETIETSQGANIPLSFAPKLWKLISICVKKGASYSEGFRLGHYSLNHIDKNGNIKVGCHNIKYNELLAIAKQLKFV